MEKEEKTLNENRKNFSYSERLNNYLVKFVNSNIFIYLVTFCILTTLLSLYIGIIILNNSIFNFLYLGVGIFACFFSYIKVKGNNNILLNKKSLDFIFLLVFMYNTIFSMIGFPILSFIKINFLNNFVFYTAIVYIIFLYFFIKQEKKYYSILFKIFLALLVIDFILPFILLIATLF